MKPLTLELGDDPLSNPEYLLVALYQDNTTIIAVDPKTKEVISKHVWIVKDYKRYYNSGHFYIMRRMNLITLSGAQYTGLYCPKNQHFCKFRLMRSKL